MAASTHMKLSSPKQQKQQSMSDSWIVIDDEHDESDFVVIEDELDKQTNNNLTSMTSPKPSPQPKRLNHKVSPNAAGTSKIGGGGGGQHNQNHNKKRKWKVLYSLPATGIKSSVNAANLDSFVMDQHAQLFDKRDLFSYQHRIVKVK